MLQHCVAGSRTPRIQPCGQFECRMSPPPTHRCCMRLLVLSAVALLLPSLASAQGSPAPAAPVLASQSDPRPSVRAMPRSGSIMIDGKLDESAWAAAVVISDFHQQVPDEGKAPTERTELRVLYDGDA